MLNVAIRLVSAHIVYVWRQVGCRIPDTAVLSHLNVLNPDMSHPVYSQPLGVYEPGCGLDKLKFAWGHDEYMYRMLVHNKATIPAAGLAMIRSAVRCSPASLTSYLAHHNHVLRCCVLVQ